MNIRKFQIEMMKTILRCSSLKYEEAYPVVIKIIPLIQDKIILAEQEESRKKQEILRKKQEELKKKQESLRKK